MLNRFSLAALVFAIAGCQHPTTNVTVTNTAEVATVSPQDFALDTVIGLLRSGVNDGPTLEAKINDPSSGINNVDVDKDGKVDYVQVVEAQIPSGKKMELIAHASSGSVPDTSIAAIKFTQSDTGIDAQTGYAPLIDPAGRYYYQDHLLANMLFAQWLFMPSRPMYLAPVPMGYAYRSRMAPTVFTQTRSSFTTSSRVSPIVSQPRPASFNAGRLTSPPRAPSTTFGQAAKGTSGFSVDSRSKPPATGFGSTSRPSSGSSFGGSSRPSSGFGGGSRPSSGFSSSPSRGRSR
jgi:hypothetical protein